MVPKRSTVVRAFPIICFCLMFRIFTIREVKRREELQEVEVRKEEEMQHPVSAEVYDESSNFQLVSGDDHVSETPYIQDGVKYKQSRSSGQPHIVLSNSVLTEDSSRANSIPERYRNSASNVFPVQNEKHKSNKSKDTLEGIDHSTIEKPRSFEDPFPLWMRITDVLYTYSAFWDHREDLPDGPVVRILGIMKYRAAVVERIAQFKWTGVVKEGALNCSCHLWYTGQQQPQVGVLKGFVFEEALKELVGTFFLCYPESLMHNKSNSDLLSTDSSINSSKVTHIPYAVSLVPEGSINSSHKLIYLSNSRMTPAHSPVTGDSSAICVRPLFGPYSDLQDITQFVSYYKEVMNVSYFYFYDLAIDRKVKELLSSFSKEIIVIKILPWNIPTSDWDELWDLGSLTALNDCVYRTSGHHRHVAVVDLDEFIVPMLPAADLEDVYHNILKFKRGQQGDAALVNNAFFCHEFMKNFNKDEEPFPIFQFTQREARLWPATSRSKMIIIPEAIVSMGHHMVHNFLLKRSKNQASPKTVSVLHHYRTCVDLRLGIHGKGSPVLKQETIKDASMLKHKRAILASRLVDIYRNFTMQDT